MNLTFFIRVYTVVQAPFIMRDENAPKGFKGYCIDLIDEIAKIVGFDYDIKEVEDQKFGNMNDKVKFYRFFMKCNFSNLSFYYRVTGMESFANLLISKLILDSAQCLSWPSVKLSLILLSPTMIWLV